MMICAWRPESRSGMLRGMALRSARSPTGGRPNHVLIIRYGIKMRERKENPMPPGDLTDEQYREQIVRPNREKNRAKLDYIAEVRAENFQKAKKKERTRRANMSLFELLDEEPPLKGWFED